MRGATWRLLLQVLTLCMPPTTQSAAYIASGAAFAEGAAPAHGPCDAHLSELLALESAGSAAALVRKMHGVPCPALQPLAQLVRSMQQLDASQRPSAADVVERLRAIEKQCAGVPPGQIPDDSELTAPYWRESAVEGCCEQDSLTSFQTESDGDSAQGAATMCDTGDEGNECAEWVRKIARLDSD